MVQLKISAKEKESDRDEKKSVVCYDTSDLEIMIDFYTE